MAVFGEGNKYLPPNRQLKNAFVGFIEVLRQVLPDSLGFLDLSVRTPEVVVITESGEFMIDASSGGITTLIDIAWRLHTYSLTHENFIVTMDEPENHLHPTMQRSLLRKLLSAFPRAQFIVATHSPFMVSSVKDSNVYVLRYANRNFSDNEIETQGKSGRRVFSEKLDTINKAGSASEILRDVLGVSATIPEWAEDGVRLIVEKYRDLEITGETLRSLRSELHLSGYDELYPDALAQLTVSR